MPISRLQIGNVAELCSLYDPLIIGITSTTANYHEAMQLAEVVKQVCPESMICYGGPHTTFAGEKVLEECDAFDVVVRGEGEYTTLELLECIHNCSPISRVAGITYRKGTITLRNKNRDLARNLDVFPLPARHLLPMRQYRKISERTSIITSRGCLFGCCFCATSCFWRHTYRRRSAESVSEEAQLIRRNYGFSILTFVDDLFLLDERTMKIFEHLRKDQVEVKWSCSTRIDLVSRASLRAASKAGCIGITFGMESGVQATLDALKKGITIEHARRVVAWCKEFSIRVKLNFIFGLPEEDKRDFESTKRLIEELNPDFVTVSGIQLLPGTDLTLQQLEQQRSSDADRFNNAVEKLSLSREDIDKELEACYAELSRKGIKRLNGW